MFAGIKRPRGFASTAAARRPFKKPRRAEIVPRFPASRARRNPRVGGFTGIEKKFVDYGINGTATTTIWAGGELDDPTALSLNAVAAGTAENQRDGRVQTLHSWFVKGFVTVADVESSVAALDDSLIRIVVYLDKQTNGAQSQAEQVFLTIGASQDVLSVKDLQNSARFRVLKDKTLLLPSARAMVNEGAINLFASGQTFIPFKMGGVFNPPIRVNYSGATAVIASITDNSLHIIATSTQVTALVSYRSRVRFTG